jgi:hypothetical protein
MRPRRIVLALTAVVLAILFVQPVRAYRNAHAHLRTAQAQLAGVRTEHDRLQRELAAAGTPGALVREARRLGYIYPGETPWVIAQP